MPSGKQRADKAKEKEKREKLILIGLVLLLVVVGAIMLPSMFKGKAGPSAASTDTTGTPTTTGAIGDGSSTGTTPTDTNGTGTSTGSGAQIAGSGFQAIPSYKPGDGKLFSLVPVNSSYPFRGVPGSETTNSSTTSTGTTKTGKTTTTGGGGGTGTTTTGSTEPFLSATIEVNGVKTAVNVGSSFPVSDPVFVLQTISSSSANMGVLGGSFADAQETLTIRRNSPVVLVNQASGVRYTVELIATSRQAAPSDSSYSTGTDTTATDTSGT